MRAKYLLHFAHEHITFRWPEFLAVTSRNECSFTLVSPVEHLQTRPFILIELNDGTTEAKLIQSARESYLIKNLYELWAQSRSIDSLSEQVEKCPYFLSKKFSGPDQSFRVNVESFASKLSQATKVEYMKNMTFFSQFESRPNLSDPEQIYCILEMNVKVKQHEKPHSQIYYFCRLLAASNRSAVNKFSLKDRFFIANTSMDPLLSLVAANTAIVKPNDIVYDPFVGSGSLLVAAAYMGAYVMGSDIDWLLVHGQSKPSRKGEKKRQDGEGVRGNLRQYHLEDRYLDIMVSDVSRRPFSEHFELDSIVTDPPYGIREGSEKIGSRRGNEPARDGRLRYPSKVNYSMDELLSDLLQLAAKHLKIGGRLVYFLPVIISDKSFEDDIPAHPSLNMIAYCEQPLTSTNFRLMVIMEKTCEPQPGDSVSIPRRLKDANFRKTYFGSGKET